MDTIFNYQNKTSKGVGGKKYSHSCMYPGTWWSDNIQLPGKFFFVCELQICSLHHYIQIHKGENIEKSIDIKIIFLLTVFIQGGSEVPRKRKGTGSLFILLCKILMWDC